MARTRVTVSVRGTETVVRNLNKKLGKIKGLSLKGLIIAAAFIRRDMDRTPPLIPVDTGNLRASWTVITLAGKKGIQMGFTAIYTAVVHFKLDGVVNWKRPNSGPLFFISAIKRNMAKIVEIVGNNAKIK